MNADIPERILANLREGVQVINDDFRYVFVNDSVVEHGRTTREQLEGRSMMDVYPGIEDTEMFATLRRCLETRTSAVMENEFTFPDGSAGWFELRFEPVPDGICVLSLEITERKRTERALQRALRVNRTLSQCNHALVRADNEPGFLRDVCKIIVEVGGYESAAVAPSEADRSILFTRVPQDHSDGAEAYGWLVEEAVERGASCVHLHPEGAPDAVARYAAPIWVGGACAGALIISSADSPAFLEDELALLDEIALDVGFGVDTLRGRRERELARRELRREQERARAIYDRLPHPTFVWRRRGGEHELVDYNGAAHEESEGGVAGVMGLSPARAMPGYPSLADDLERALEEGVVTRELACALPGMTERRQLAVTVGRVFDDLALMVTQDVTEQRETEQRLVRSQRLEAVGQLAGGVAHDFNNLLSVILLYVEMALETPDLSTEIRADLREIADAGQRASQLTNQLLAFGRKQVFAPRHVRLGDVLSGLETLLRRLLREDIEVRIDPRAEPDGVLSDPGQLEQIIVNLAVNARDAMPDGGVLTMETEVRELDAPELELPPGRYVCLIVRDTGAGMPPETVGRIFEPFFTTKEVGHGTGLGLATVYGIVKRSGGEVRVQSEVGRGTQFTIYFPHTPAVTPESPQLPNRLPGPRGSETVLLLEDDDNVRRAVSRILSSAGFDVLVAADGDEALRLADAHDGTIGLVLSDVVIPGGNALEVVDQILEGRPDASVLFVSGYSANAITQRGVQDSRKHYLPKPFTGEQLRQKVRSVLDSAR